MTESHHPLDVVSLVAGIAFVVVGLAGLTSWLTALDWQTLTWLVPAALIIVGIAVLASSLRGGGEGEQPAQVDRSQPGNTRPEPAEAAGRAEPAEAAGRTEPADAPPEDRPTDDGPLR